MIKSSLLSFYNNSWKVEKHSAYFSNSNSQLLLAFGSKVLISSQEIFDKIKLDFPNADLVFCSTSGEINGGFVNDDSISLLALEFQKTKIKTISKSIFETDKDSKKIGRELFELLNADDLSGIIVFSDGIHVNGGELVDGLNLKNSKGISITGGLAGDGANFSSTLTGLNSLPKEGEVIAIGLYGDSIKIGHGSLGGWDEFGTTRTITKSDKNVLLELDGKSALDLYKEYLGAYASELPASALLFPLSLQTGENENIVRTILTIDEEKQSMTFAGNMPEGMQVRLMKANFDKLIEASSSAAKSSSEYLANSKPEVALLVSCVGRKLILQERTEEEVDAAKEILGDNCTLAGFYSYGEISPLNHSIKCELHNQTMTITTLSEV